MRLDVKCAKRGAKFNAKLVVLGAKAHAKWNAKLCAKSGAISEQFGPEEDVNSKCYIVAAFPKHSEA